MHVALCMRRITHYCNTHYYSLHLNRQLMLVRQHGNWSTACGLFPPNPPSHHCNLAQIVLSQILQCAANSREAWEEGSEHNNNKNLASMSPEKLWYRA